MTALSEDDFVIHLERCNRCGWNGFEKFSTHSYCTNCNYSPDADYVSGDDHAAIPQWAIRALKGETDPEIITDLKVIVSPTWARSVA